MNEEYKCKDCKWLTGQKNIRGIECMHPKNQEKWNKAKTLWMGELRKDSARYKQGSALACKKFEAKESEHMGRYIDADALIAKMPTVMDMQDTYLPIHFKEWLIDSAPSIDIEPKRGKWEEKETFHNEDDNPIIEEWQSARCSVCNKYHTTPYMYYFNDYNFCPNCGARMKGADDE